MPLKLGKLAPKPNRYSLNFRNYVGLALTPPAKNYWEYLIKAWLMYLNDKLGSCVFACGGHMEQNWSAHAGKPYAPTDADILAAYEAVGGYDPSKEMPDGTNPTDNGAVITDFLQWWMQNGLAGHKILGWAQIGLDHLSVKQALFVFGAVDIGIQVPAVAMDQFNAGMPWDSVDDDGGIEGGHSIPILGQGHNGFACITWGKIQYMTNAFFDKYCDEAYAIVTQDWLNAQGRSPIAGFDLATLQTDLAEIKA